MVKYYKEIRDKNGFIYSIDNTVVDYFIKGENLERITKELVDIRKKYDPNGWERLNIGACSKYSFFQNVVHIGAIHISYGKYTSFDKVSRTWIMLPMLRLEVNVNKHYEEQAFKEILSWVHKNCTDGILKKYDLAIDIPYSIDRVQILDSRKEPGLHKGTIYRGQRSHHGFCKVYDKAREQKIDGQLTRIEHTLEPRKPLSLERIGIIQSVDKSTDTSNLDNLNSCIVSLCLLVKSCGLDYEPYVAKLNYRRKKTLQPYLYGSSIDFEYDEEIIEKLLVNIIELFDVNKEKNDCESKGSIYIDESGFAQIDDDEELPFE